VRVPSASRCVYLSPVGVPEIWVGRGQRFAPPPRRSREVDLNSESVTRLLRTKFSPATEDQLLRFYPERTQYVKPSGPVTARTYILLIVRDDRRGEVGLDHRQPDARRRPFVDPHPPLARLRVESICLNVTT